MDYGIPAARRSSARRARARQGLRDGARAAKASTSSSTRAARRAGRDGRRDPPQRPGSRHRDRGRHHDARGPRAVLAACPTPDILVNNAGGPPIGDFRDWDEAAWQKAVNDNMITPIMLIRGVVDGMIARRFGRIVNITSRSVKAPLAHLGLSNGARAGLTGFVAGLARQVAKHNVSDQQPAARPVRHRAHSGRPAQAVGEGRTGLRHVRGARWPRIRPDASARPTSSARPAHSCAAPTRASSSARTC